MDKLGLNCLLTRVDFTDLTRVRHGLRDFLIRCKNHGLYVWLAFVKATVSKHYCEEAIEELFKLAPIKDNPTVMAIDLEWESANDYFNPVVSEEFNDEWQGWLERKYGSIGQAEVALEICFNRDRFGYVCVPPMTSKMIARDYRHYVDDSINNSWSQLSKHLRGMIPNQMLTFRSGAAVHRGKAQAAEYIDFSALEIYNLDGYYSGYDIDRDPIDSQRAVGYCVCASLIQQHETNGKPVVWAEYGRSACGIKWHNKLIYDHENQSYTAHEVAEQTAYNDIILSAIRKASCAGSAPWWWCGGFRFTELADFGYVMPDGLLTKSGIRYVEFCNEMKTIYSQATDDKRDNELEYRIEGDIDEYIGGKTEFVKNVCVPAYLDANKSGMKISIQTRYESDNA